MRGRTNILGGGMNINGSVGSFLIERGNSILPGDFVEYTFVSDVKTLSEGNTNALECIFNIKDDLYICVYEGQIRLVEVVNGVLYFRYIRDIIYASNLKRLRDNLFLAYSKTSNEICFFNVNVLDKTFDSIIIYNSSYSNEITVCNENKIIRFSSFIKGSTSSGTSVYGQLSYEVIDVSDLNNIVILNSSSVNVDPEITGTDVTADDVYEGRFYVILSQILEYMFDDELNVFSEVSVKNSTGEIISSDNKRYLVIKTSRSLGVIDKLNGVVRYYTLSSFLNGYAGSSQDEVYFTNINKNGVFYIFTSASESGRYIYQLALRSVKIVEGVLTSNSNFLLIDKEKIKVNGNFPDMNGISLSNGSSIIPFCKYDEYYNVYYINIQNIGNNLVIGFSENTVRSYSGENTIVGVAKEMGKEDEMIEVYIPNIEGV